MIEDKAKPVQSEPVVRLFPNVVPEEASAKYAEGVLSDWFLIDPGLQTRQVAAEMQTVIQVALDLEGGCVDTALRRLGEVEDFFNTYKDNVSRSSKLGWFVRYGGRIVQDLKNMQTPRSEAEQIQATNADPCDAVTGTVCANGAGKVFEFEHPVRTNETASALAWLSEDEADAVGLLTVAKEIDGFFPGVVKVVQPHPQGLRMMGLLSAFEDAARWQLSISPRGCRKAMKLQVLIEYADRLHTWYKKDKTKHRMVLEMLSIEDMLPLCRTNGLANHLLDRARHIATVVESIGDEKALTDARRLIKLCETGVEKQNT